MTKEIEEFISESKALGYDISGSVFKADYNGKMWSVGFWIRPSMYCEKKKDYILRGRIGKAKDKDFKVAVETAMRKAKLLERNRLNREM